LEAAKVAGTDADEFVALVKELKCEKRRVEDLLAKGELWAAVRAAAERANTTITLGAFFDYCKRETQPPHAIWLNRRSARQKDRAALKRTCRHQKPCGRGCR
jgi:hypothetical protein